MLCEGEYMDFRLLVTVSDARGALLGIRFLHLFFHSKARLRLTLCRIEQDSNGDAGIDNTTAVNAVRQDLWQWGFDPSAIDIVTPPCHMPVAESILWQAEQGHFDAIVLGKQGLSWFERMLSKNSGLELLQHNSRLPYWICRPMTEQQRNILLCVDESGHSQHMIEHVAQILRMEERHRVTLLHVAHPAMTALDKQEQALDNAWTLLESRGVASSRIRSRVIESSDIVRAIIHHAAAGNYATVAVGRGKPQVDATGLKRFFMGSVSMGLFRGMKHQSLWVCH